LANGGKTLEGMENMSNIVIVDIDGTLADCEHRMEHIKKHPRDWDSFYSLVSGDTPHYEIITMVNALANEYVILLMTGRREETREDTENWLAEHEVVYHALMMRPPGNRDDDHTWKISIGRMFGLQNIAFVIEDRNRIVEAWRNVGVRCIQVADGPF